MERCYDVLTEDGGRGVRGTKTFRWVVKERIHDTATGSRSEFELLYHMQMAFLPRPELSHELIVNGQRRVPDFYWPTFGKAVEVDGVDAKPLPTGSTTTWSGKTTSLTRVCRSVGSALVASGVSRDR